MFESPNPDALTASPQTDAENTSPFELEGGSLDILQNAPIGIHFVDAAGTILWANNYQLEMLGYSGDEYVGKNVRDFHEDKDLFEQIFDDLSNGVPVENREVSLISKDGSVRIASLDSNVRRIDGQFIHSRCFFRDITDQKREEKSFRERASEDARKLRLYEAILSRISDFNQAYDKDGRIIYVNQALLDLWGKVPLEDVVGKNFFDLNYPEELAQRLEKQIKSVFETGKGLKDETQYTSPAGVDGVYEYIFQPVMDESGRVEMVTGSTRDISELSRTIADLRQTQELLRLAMISSRMGAWTRDLAGGSVEWAPELESIFGLDPGSFSGDENAFLEKVFPEDRSKVTEAVSGAIENKSEYIVQFRFIHADGSVRWMEGRGRAFYDDDGVPKRLFGIGIDITERETAAEARRENERSLEEMANAFPQLAWMADPDGYIFWYNQQWYEFTGTTLEQMKGWGWQSVHDPEMLPQVLEKWKNSVCEGEAFEMEFPILRYDGKFQWFLTRATPFRGADGTIKRWFGTNTNIDEIRNIRIRSEEASRSKDEFLAMLSHELRAPLNLMAGWSQILKATDYEEGTVRKAIDVIFRNVELQSALIEDLLDVSRIVTEKIEIESKPVDFADIVTDVVEVVKQDASKKDVEITLDIDVENTVILGDSHRLTQIVSNLLNNSIKFTPGGGRIDVHLSNSDKFVKFKVVDNGIGIEDEMLPFIFERFRQADTTSTRAFGGLGLGLSIVESLVSMHGGSVSARSEGLNHGAEFLVELPLAAVVSPEVKTKISTNDNARSLKGLRVLVVDDDPDSLELMAMFLELEGLTVTRSTSASEALSHFPSSTFDLMISDLGMPDVDGYDLIRKLRESIPSEKLPAIALTGFASERDRSLVYEAGFQAHIAKPVEFDHLLAEIRTQVRSLA